MPIGEPTMPTAENSLNENSEKGAGGDKISEYRKQINAAKNLLEDEMWSEESREKIENGLEELMNGLKGKIGEENAKQITALDSLIKDEMWSEDGSYAI